MYHATLVGLSRNLVKLSDLIPTSVTLHQYDQSPLTVNGQCHTTVQVYGHAFEATFIVGGVSTQYPLFDKPCLEETKCHFWGLTSQP